MTKDEAFLCTRLDGLCCKPKTQGDSVKALLNYKGRIQLKSLLRKVNFHILRTKKLDKIMEINLLLAHHNFMNMSYALVDTI